MSKLEEIIANLFIISCTVGVCLVVYKITIPEPPRYRLINCGGITSCDNLGIFKTKEACENMKNKLESDSQVFKYECEEVK